MQVAESPKKGYFAVYNVSDSSPDKNTVLFALPITVGAMGALEFLLSAGLLLYICVFYQPVRLHRPFVATRSGGTRAVVISRGDS